MRAEGSPCLMKEPACWGYCSPRLLGDCIVQMVRLRNDAPAGRYTNDLLKLINHRLNESTK